MMRKFVFATIGMVVLPACVSAAATHNQPLADITPVVSTTAPAPEADTQPFVPGDVVAPLGSWDPIAGAPVEYPARVVVEQPFVPFATVGRITLTHPSDRVETIGFHESTNDGAQQQTALDAAAAPFTMETRERPTDSRTAADVAIDPDRPVRSPVTGTVIRSGTYVLYCEYSDDFAVIEPDDEPGWEVKILHINNVQVFRGDRVEAGVTVIADGPTPLPFRSQVDEATSAPSWPHVHIEVIDPSIPDIPSGAGC